MKLKIRKFNWLAGRPVVLLNPKTASKLNVRPDERVSLNGRKIYAVVDIFNNLISNEEIGISEELSVLLHKKNEDLIEVYPAALHKAGVLISNKLEGKELSKEEIKEIISEIVQNNLTESEIAYFLSAEKLIGMSFNEIVFLIQAMVESGKKLDFGNKIVADKHCIGGIAGNRTTPIVVSICASAGLLIPKTSSRAITSASGTADVVETIAKVEFSAEELKKIVEKTGACLVWGGSLGLAPSDDKIIHVERIINIDVESQLLASIMSKKISVGSNHILIDIPYGKETKVKNIQQAKRLGEKFRKIAKFFKLKLKTVYTNGEDPIGNGIGPVLEMLDVISVLKNEANCSEKLKEKSLFLASQLLELCGHKNSMKEAEEILFSGKAYQKFKEIINIQNGKEKNSNDFEARISKLKTANLNRGIFAEKSGNIENIDNKMINNLARILGTPDNKSAGIFIHKNSGVVKKGEKILTLYTESQAKLNEASSIIKEKKPIEIK
jgi:AMP phosphorylase